MFCAVRSSRILESVHRPEERDDSVSPSISTKQRYFENVSVLERRLIRRYNITVGHARSVVSKAQAKLGLKKNVTFSKSLETECERLLKLPERRSTSKGSVTSCESISSRTWDSLSRTTASRSSRGTSVSEDVKSLGGSKLTASLTEQFLARYGGTRVVKRVDDGCSLSMGSTRHSRTNLVLTKSRKGKGRANRHAKHLRNRNVSVGRAFEPGTWSENVVLTIQAGLGHSDDTTYSSLTSMTESFGEETLSELQSWDSAPTLPAVPEHRVTSEHEDLPEIIDDTEANKCPEGSVPIQTAKEVVRDLTKSPGVVPKATMDATARVLAARGSMSAVARVCAQRESLKKKRRG